MIPLQVVLWPKDPQDPAERLQVVAVEQVEEIDQYGEPIVVLYLSAPIRGGTARRRYCLADYHSVEIVSHVFSYPIRARPKQVKDPLEEDLHRADVTVYGLDWRTGETAPPDKEDGPGLRTSSLDRKQAILYAARHAGFNPPADSISVSPLE